jgi:hypothetical protein
VQEPVGRDAKDPVSLAILCVPGCLRNLADPIAGLGPCPAESTEIVLTYETFGGFVHSREVGFALEQPSEAGVERSWLQRDAVFVCSPDGAVACMEIARNLFDFDDSDRSWEETVQSTPKFPRIDAFRQAKMSHLSSRVDAGIRPSGPNDVRALTDQYGKGLLDLRLHTGNARLCLPAVQLGAVVFDK